MNIEAGIIGKEIEGERELCRKEKVPNSSF